MQVIVQNGLNRTAYLRYEDLATRPLPQPDHATYNEPVRDSTSGGVSVPANYSIDPGQTATFTFDVDETWKGGVVWADKDAKVHNAGGPQCTQFEFSIENKEINFDITQLEGLCHGYKVKLDDVDAAQCGYDVNATTQHSFPSDKGASNETWRLNAGCSEDTMAKDCCHRFMARNSYSSGGFCNALHDPEANCNAYCWAYDEKRCLNADTCKFDSDCNPTDKVDHPPVLHVQRVTNQSKLEVFISELSEKMYEHMQAHVRPNYGDHTDEARCGNPHTCGASTPSGGTPSSGTPSGTKPSTTTKTVLIVAGALVAALVLLVLMHGSVP